jgi:hypothetical protein
MTATADRQGAALRTARLLLDIGHPLEVVLENPLIPAEFREYVQDQLHRERNITLAPARTIVADQNRADWLSSLDRSAWYYWPALRDYLLTVKGWDTASIRSLDNSSDRIVRQLAAPWEETFDIRGLVLGFVQSGKTSNYTAVIAKAADAGYRLIVVLSGVDNGLRRQTQTRLKRELVGYPDNRVGTVRLPPRGRQWHEFTREDINGDFQPGYANHAALQGSQPVLLVVKKNGPVLRRLLRWLDEAPAELRLSLPVLIVDDEADQASVDTRGSYQTDEGPEDPEDPEYEEPSVINGLIRNLLVSFQRRSYVAYTATPFANVLIPDDATDPTVGSDLYPKDFIVDLPKPRGYFGAEEFFGRMDYSGSESVDGLDVIRDVPDTDLADLQNGNIPHSLHNALMDFVLAGSARAQRGGSSNPATMLIHTSQRILQQAQLRHLVDQHFSELRDEWRYHRRSGIRERFSERWESEFRAVTRASHMALDVGFDVIEPFLGPFFEAVQVREINSATGQVLDYEREPSLKAIAIGGNRLSRGLTLEGLLVSFFVRRSVTYDTLMQMGRWFGFREGYEDLTRIHTTAELAGWFADLAFVEHRLREDIQVYEALGLTPREVGTRIWQHPVMQVTSPLKRRFASNTTISQSYRLHLEQTFKFPLMRLEDLALQAEENRSAVRALADRLGPSDRSLTDAKGPVWTAVPAARVLEFLASYRVDERARSISVPLISAYIQRLTEAGELLNWTIAVRGREAQDRQLSAADWHLPTGPVNQISRSRLGATDSVGVITSPGDEAVGLPQELLVQARALVDAGESENRAARRVRAPQEGLLLLYPISRHSGQGLQEGANRKPLYENPADALARDLVGLAISFPDSPQPQHVEAYLEGTLRWRAAE